MNHKLSAILLSVVLVLSMFAVAPVNAQEETDDPEQESAHTRYIVTHDTETGESEVRVEIKMVEEKEYNDWSISWEIPESATVENVRTSHSETVNQNRDGGLVEFTEEDGPARNTETFYITYTTTEFLTKTDVEYVNQYEVTASALTGEESYLEINFEGDEELANAIRFSDHSLNVTENKFTADGTGPPSFYINTMKEEPAVETDDYVVYGKELPKEKLNNSYAISTNTTGVVPQFKQVPVIVLSEDNYDQSINTSSEGRFRSGIIILSEEITGEGTLLPLLTHEYTHAITQRMEPTTPSVWFTEGASQYTEAVALDKVGRSQTTIDEERFWDYHSNNKSWVSNDNSWGETNADRQAFAYGYAELLFKYKQSQESSNYVHKLYSDMATDEITIDRNTKPTIMYGENWNGKVCERDTKQETINCMEQTMDNIPELTQPEEYTTAFDSDPQTKQITYEEAETPTPTETPSETPTPSTDSEEDKGWIQIIIDFIAQIIEKILSFF